jgi:hypothetical protein
MKIEGTLPDSFLLFFPVGVDAAALEHEQERAKAEKHYRSLKAAGKEPSADPLLQTFVKRELEYQHTLVREKERERERERREKRGREKERRRKRETERQRINREKENTLLIASSLRPQRLNALKGGSKSPSSQPTKSSDDDFFEIPQKLTIPGGVSIRTKYDFDARAEAKAQSAEEAAYAKGPFDEVVAKEAKKREQKGMQSVEGKKKENERETERQRGRERGRENRRESK